MPPHLPELILLHEKLVFNISSVFNLYSKLQMLTVVCRSPVMRRGQDWEAEQKMRPLWLDDIPSDGLPQLQAKSPSRSAQHANHLAGEQCMLFTKNACKSSACLAARTHVPI